MRKYSFTLIEILAVTAIIIILATVGFGGYSYAMERSKISATEAVIKQIEVALNNYKAKFGYYPSTAKQYANIRFTRNSSQKIVVVDFVNEGGSTVGESLGADIGIPSNRKERESVEQLRAFIQNIELDKLDRFIDWSDDKGFLVDSWGGRIAYRAPGVINTKTFDLISAGPDDHFGNLSTSAAAGKTPANLTDAGKSANSDSRKKILNTYVDDNGEKITDDIANF